MGEEDRMKTVIFLEDLDKLKEALLEFNIEEFSGKTVPLKLHMGEVKNRYYPRPSTIKMVVDQLKGFNVKPFLFDTTVAYRGLRHSQRGYEKVAALHGFTKIGCDVVIDDKGIPVEVSNRIYEVAEHIYNATHIVAFTHVKGHIAVGMGGAIKNFGMGGVTKETKQRMHHNSRPVFRERNCIRCGVCAEVCPFNAIRIRDNRWIHNLKACFGCGVCVENCRYAALAYKDLDLQYALACAAKACLDGKQVIYISELKRIARSCDCDPSAGPIICRDIGFLVSDDPVAVDQASLDLIYEVEPDVFKKLNHVDPVKQIRFGEELGLGSSRYSLKEL